MKLRHICENCGKDEILTSEEGFQQGWDYPPAMGEFGVISPRNCGNCGIVDTLYFRILMWQKEHGDEPYQLTEAEKVLYERIVNEPDSILVTDDAPPGTMPTREGPI